MSIVVDYLLMKLPTEHDPLRLQKSEASATREVSTSRITISFIGILLGIFVSFVVTGLEKVSSDSETAQQISTETHPDIKVKFPPMEDLASIGLVSLVICILSYQGLYAGLKMYRNEPWLLVFCFSFQYGFFWHSVIKGGSIIIS